MKTEIDRGSETVNFVFEDDIEIEEMYKNFCKRTGTELDLYDELCVVAQEDEDFLGYLRQRFLNVTYPDFDVQLEVQ